MNRFLLFTAICVCVSATPTVNAVGDEEFRELVRRMELLEEKEKRSDDVINSLQNQVHEQSALIQELLVDKATKDDIISELAVRIARVKQNQQTDVNTEYPTSLQDTTTIQTTNTDNDSTSIETEDDSEDTTSTAEVINPRRYQRFVVDPEVPVAFHAVISKHDMNQIGHNQNIVFETVFLNLGAGYHNQPGTFIAPIAGVYVFSASILSYIDPTPEFEAEVVKNGQVLGRVFTHGDNGRLDQGSVTITTQLQAADEVLVRQVKGTRVSGSRFSSFTGFLLVSL